MTTAIIPTIRSIIDDFSRLVNPVLSPLRSCQLARCPVFIFPKTKMAFPNGVPAVIEVGLSVDGHPELLGSEDKPQPRKLHTG